MLGLITAAALAASAHSACLLPDPADQVGQTLSIDLSGRRGPGLALWEALWGDESHYAAHRYKVVTYQWKDGRFVGPTVTTTTRAFDPAPDDVARRLGFAFRDLHHETC